jgi:hypothetical protein
MSVARKPTALSLTLALAAVLIVAVSVASAAGPTRAEYLAQTEPICQANTDGNRTILKGVQKKIRNQQFAPAGKQFLRAAAAFKKTINQVDAVPKPDADIALLTPWIAKLRQAQTMLQRIGSLVKKKKAFKAQGIVVKLSRHAIQTNNSVAGFGFESCQLQASRFTGT